MATSFKDNIQKKHGDSELIGEEIVISGISGVFPKSQDVLEFMENLYNKVDMVTNDEPRWTLNDPDVPKHIGKINGLEKFDAQFFKVGFQLGCVMEPMARKLLEHAYGAIIDSGSNLIQLKEKKVGVFIGSSFADHSALAMYGIQKRSDFIVSGCSKAMLANRISFWVDGRGPTYNLDYACSSSMACLEQAYKSMQAGECEAALIGGCNYCTQPCLTVNLRRAGLLCLDGKTKCFDKNGDGYVRSDAVNILFLQKAKDAKRIYAQVCHAKGMYQMKANGPMLPIRDPNDMQKFFEEFYSEINVGPVDIEYVEANGAAIAEADGNELEAIGRVFAKDKIVKVGCIKSNMGHSEPASGVCALTKICLAYHQGQLPANLHYNEPQDHIPAIRDGRIQIITENESFKRDYAAVNSFSYTGANFHALLKGHYKKKDLNKYTSKIPHVVLVSGRQESCLNKIFNLLKSQPIDPEQIALLHNVFKNDIPGHLGRGYTILGTNENNETVSLSQSVEYYPGDKRPLWFVFSGMGSQWVGMGSNLMKIPVFAAAIERCHKVLEPRGIDIYKILTDTDNKVLDNILNAFVGIGAIQIGLTDILKEIGLVPDYIIGHSLGEMACAYHDNTFTAEELMLSTYCRGSVCLNIPVIKGSMAAVGLGYNAMVTQCPPEIDVACHNSFESSTLSGPADIVKEFVADLTSRGIFAREVPCANVPYHSRYIAHSGPKLEESLREVIKDPKPRSKKWISSSIPMDRWDEPLAKYSSAEYHANNLLSPVLFEEMSKLIPANAIVVEVAPHGLLQAILKRSLKDCTHVPLTRKGNKDGVKFLLDAIGKLYQVGLNPNVEKLYPQIEFPVSTETPFLSRFVEWDHSEDWPSIKYEDVEKRTAMARNAIISTKSDDYKYFEGYVRDGMNIVSESAILVLVWETLAMYNNMNYKDMSIAFRDIHFHTEVIVSQTLPVRLSIVISKGNNKFEVSQEDILIVSGIVDGYVQSHRNINNTEIEEDDALNSEDIYKILRIRGFDYNHQFQCIHSMNLVRDNAYIKWKNWVTFLDSLIQLNILSRDHDGISIPKFIKKVSINVRDHQKYIPNEVKDVSCYNARFNRAYGVTRCTGVEIDNITFVDKPKVEKEPDVLGVKNFFPYYMMESIELKKAIQIILQIVAENTTAKGLQMTELIDNHVSEIFLKLNEVVNATTFIDINIVSVVFDDNNIEDITQAGENFRENIYVIENLIEDEKKINKLCSKIKRDAFVIAIENHVPMTQSIIKEHFNLITSMSDGKKILLLLRKVNLKQNDTFISIPYDVKFSWINNFYSELQKTKRVVLVSERQPFCGLEGLIKKLKSDGVEKVGLIITEDFSAPRFNPEDHFYKEQLKKNLAINILKKGRWGGYYYTECTQSIYLRNVSLTCSLPGDLGSLIWVEASPVAAKNTLVQVSFSGLSFLDTQKAVFGVRNEDNNSFGMDYSGLDYMGERVMGVVLDGAISSTVEADLNLLWPVPDHWSLEDAATVPLPYLHAYYCLIITGNLLKGQSVLVTGGAGALGQAVISLCLSVDCTVYTTVSNMKKKQLLLKLFPCLEENNIGYSRHESFCNMVISNSKKRRCDIVVNCATGSIREAAMKCVGFSGLFLDISNYDMTNNRNIGMNYLEKERSYKAVTLSNIFRPENINNKKKLQILISEGIAKGIVKPISRVVYSPTDVSRAFRLLSSSRHRGRVLIRMRDPVILSQGLKVTPRMIYSSNGVYVVICDEAGWGIELVDRIIKQGAKKIMLHLKPDFITGYVRTKFLSWTREDLSIRLSSENLQTEQGCVKLLKDGAKLGQVKGIFIVQDITTKNSYVDRQEDFVKKFNTFSLIVLNMDLSSRNFCPSLSQFVVIIRPSHNDSENHAAAVSERICQTRHDIGCPALILKSGSLDEFAEPSTESQSKTQPQKFTSLFNALERSLKLTYNNVLSFNINNKSNAVFLHKIADILGFKTLDGANDTATVQDYNLNEVNFEEMRSIIKKAYQCDYPIDKIKQLTIGSLRTLGNSFTETYKKLNHGLGAFYNNIDDEADYISISHPIVPQITMLNNGNENDLDPNYTYLIMIPGFEGRHQTFNTISEMLKIQAVTVQLGVDMNEDSISELAMSVRKLMKTKFETTSKFYLLGYSFGVNVALELAALLEKEGHVGVVFCLDSSPDALRFQINANLGTLSESQLQNAVIEHIYQLMTGDSLTKNVENIETWSEKVEVCIEEMKRSVNYSNQYKRHILMTAYKRLVLAHEYEPDFKLESQLVLIKGIQHPKADILTDDYNLSKYTKQPVQVFNIQSDHYSATENYQVSNIVNRMLDPKLLEEFKNKSLCDTYIL